MPTGVSIESHNTVVFGVARSAVSHKIVLPLMWVDFFIVRVKGELSFLRYDKGKAKRVNYYYTTGQKF